MNDAVTPRPCGAATKPSTRADVKNPRSCDKKPHGTRRGVVPRRRSQGPRGNLCVLRGLGMFRRDLQGHITTFAESLGAWSAFIRTSGNGAARTWMSAARVFEFKDGKIIDGREHFDDLYAWDAFWVP